MGLKELLKLLLVWVFPLVCIHVRFCYYFACFFSSLPFLRQGGKVVRYLGLAWTSVASCLSLLSQILFKKNNNHHAIYFEDAT